MKMSDLRAKARAIFGSAVAEPMPNQPNGAKALQQRANARPIPTYKVGGVVKKANGGTMKPKVSTAERKMGDALMMTRKGKEIMNAQKRMEDEKEMQRRKKQEAADKLLGIRMKNGGKMPDLTGDGKVTRADVLKGRGVEGFQKGGKVQTSSDTARKLATEMGGMKKGGKAKDGLAVMIAIGKPMKKPVKKMGGGMAYAHGGKPEKLAVGGAGKTRKGMAPIKKAQGGAAKVRKGMMSETGDIKQVVKPKKGLGGM